MPAKFNTVLPSVNGLSLQQCSKCGHISYPVRELCGNCLADSLVWQSVDGGGTVQSVTALHYPLETNFSRQLPWRIASVKLDAGPVAFAHLQPGIECKARVTLSIAQDEMDNNVLVATGENESASQWLTPIKFTEITA
jgi:uncharacterized OB-fold protein